MKDSYKYTETWMEPARKTLSKSIALTSETQNRARHPERSTTVAVAAAQEPIAAAAAGAVAAAGAAARRS